MKINGNLKKLKFFEVPLSIVLGCHLKLHNSQTVKKMRTLKMVFEIHLKIHNSQTEVKTYLSV